MTGEHRRKVVDFMRVVVSRWWYELLEKESVFDGIGDCSICCRYKMV